MCRGSLILPESLVGPSLPLSSISRTFSRSTVNLFFAPSAGRVLVLVLVDQYPGLGHGLVIAAILPSVHLRPRRDMTGAAVVASVARERRAVRVPPESLVSFVRVQVTLARLATPMMLRCFCRHSFKPYRTRPPHCFAIAKFLRCGFVPSRASMNSAKLRSLASYPS
jgi:hypothetical protein